MTYEEIAAMLAAGKSEEDIAKEFTNHLNKAVADRKAQEAKEAEAKHRNVKLNNIAKTLTTAINEYAMVAGVENVALDTAEVRQILDEFLPVLDQFKNIKVHVAKADPKATKKALKTADDVFNWFFKELGI